MTQMTKNIRQHLCFLFEHRFVVYSIALLEYNIMHPVDAQN